MVPSRVALLRHAQDSRALCKPPPLECVSLLLQLTQQGIILALIEGMMIGINRIMTDSNKPVMQTMPSDPFDNKSKF